METFDTDNEQPNINQGEELPKPVLVQDKKNWIRKSLISLAIYGFLFAILFNMELVSIAAVLVVLLIHEFGHFFAMKAFNYNNVKMFILPLLGAYVTGKKSIISQKQMTIVILAGPVPGIIIGFCLLIYNIYHPNEKLEKLGEIFMGLNFFNLLPFIPLDGGRLLETLFINQNHVIRIIFTIISIMALLILAILLKSLFFLIIPVAMVFDLIMEVKNQKIREYLTQEKINYTLDYADLPNKDYWIIRDCLLLSFSKRYSGVQAGVHQYSIAEGGILQHVMSILKTPYLLDLKAFGKIIVILLYITFLIGLPLSYVILKYAH